MEEKKKTPQVRHSRFDGNWETVKLSTIADRITRKNSNMESTLPLTISAQYGLVDQTSFFNSQIAGQNINNYFLLMNGEFAYNKSTSQDYPVGAVKRLDRYDMGVLSTLYILFKPNAEVSSDYLVTYFDSNYWHKEIKLRAAEGARNHGLLNISPDDFFDIDINMPKDIDEQRKIGAFLQKVDLIVSNRRSNLEKLQALRLSMLEKMFPKGDESIPEVRFKGFDGAWKKYPLKDIVQPYADPVLTPSNGYYRLGIRSHGKGTFHSYVAPGMELETAQMHRVAENNLIVNITFAWEHAVAITDQSDSGKLVSHRFPQFKFNENMVPRFFKYAILDDKFRYHLRLASPGGAGRNRVLKVDEMLQYEFWVPSTVEEQKKIADYLEVIDKTINLRKQELQKMLSLKKALLEKMFV